MLLRVAEPVSRPRAAGADDRQSPGARVLPGAAVSDCDPAGADLSEVPTSTLERLCEAIARNRLKIPVTRTALLDEGIRNQLDPLEDALSGHTALACRGLLEAVLAERRAHS